MPKISASPSLPVLPSKRCPHCKRTTTEWSRNAAQSDGLETWCQPCNRARKRGKVRELTAKAAARDEKMLAEREAAARRLASDDLPLQPSDFDVGVANDRSPRARALSGKASAEKRQEFNARMGEHARELRAAAVAQATGKGPIASHLSGETGEYVARLAEQERRFGNRRMARAVALFDAGEALALHQFKLAAAQYLRGKITATGYALKAPPAKPLKRSTVVLLSDLHLGSDLSSLDEPIPFGAVQEARRLEHVLRQVLDYKPQYRDQSEAVILLNGDLIEGLLGWDPQSGAPLTEQKVVAWRHLGAFVAHVARAYRSVRVVCQPGNHGRDKVRHPGRATSRKWDGHEFEIYYGLREMAHNLHNVEWQIDFRAVSIVDLHGSTLGLTHGDTEVPLGDPDTRSTQNAQAFDRINSTNLWGVSFDAWCVGHFHKPRYQPRRPRVIWNGALVPPNGHARSKGYVGEPCGQFLWEAVEGFPVGDLRFVEVGAAQDDDERLGKLITPFRFDL